MKNIGTSCKVAMVIVASTAMPTHAETAAAATVLRCQVRYASDTIHIETRPVANPYTVTSQDIGERFRFKAVMVGNDRQVDYIALYAYDMAMPGAPLLIHEVVHQPPFSSNTTVPGLTGWNHAYSARLGREMVYGCALTNKAAP
ncbi:hypothetical protein [Aquabacterium sp.]|uniref:hypothetical protein n=1 Tax=Aquabacterium sp. TaxID=1872578 RepID=UPI0024873B40|nr:hypothetical protein [Aquabacterium sp.]MDI1259878.1 hypothetical protein [Aquabacterium sp.]